MGVPHICHIFSSWSKSEFPGRIGCRKNISPSTHLRTSVNESPDKTIFDRTQLPRCQFLRHNSSPRGEAQADGTIASRRSLCNVVPSCASSQHSCQQLLSEDRTIVPDQSLRFAENRCSRSRDSLPSYRDARCDSGYRDVKYFADPED